MRGILTFANGSSSSLYGCIGYSLQDYIVSRFPKDFFNYTTMSSELATRNIRRTFKKANTKKEIVKRQKPGLIIQPTFPDNDNDSALQGIPLTRNFDDLQYRTDKLYLFEVIRDKKYGYDLKFKMNRDKIEYDVTIQLDTLHQQIDLYNTMKNQMIWERSFANRMALEAIIPKSTIATISKICNMDIEKSPEYIPILLKRLNSTSAYPITYKMRNASATDEWFMYYTHNVIFTFSDLSKPEGNRKGMSEEIYTINFRVTAEFNLPGVYFVEGDLDIVKQVDVSLVATNNYPDSTDGFIPMFTIDNLYTRFPPEKDGMQLYGTTIFKTDEGPNQIEDRVDLCGAIDNEHLKVVRLHRSWHMNPHTLLQVIVLKNRQYLEEDKDFYVDYNTMELAVLHPDKTATYRLVVYFNYNTVNEILSNTAYENVRDMDRPNPNMFPGPAEDGVFVSTPDPNPDETMKSTTQFTDTEKIPEDVENPQIIERGHMHHFGDIDPSYVLQKDRVFLNNSEEPEAYLHPAENLYPEGKVPEEKQDQVDESVLSLDNHDVYDHPLEVPVGQQETEHYTPPHPHPHPMPGEEDKTHFPINLEGTVSDIHNSVITDPEKAKKFSSQKPDVVEDINKKKASGKKFHSSKK